ncbi:hypothetical protein ACSBL2_24585 [Pedobacter sp. AW31-3R]|uniref:hypothetical protein n=1 Tax=Pedobacter sp. AW31-3R TaxID=3445781 RepID=UPI003F9F5D66
MSINQFNNKIVRFGQSLINYPAGITLNGRGLSFPNSTPSNTGSFILIFNEATQVSINYGNGIVINYPTTQTAVGSHTFHIYAKGSNTFSTPPAYAFTKYVYPDGLTDADRTVNIQYRRDLLKQFLSVSNTFLIVQDLAFEFAKHPSLEIFQMTLTNIVNRFNLKSVNAISNPKLINLFINSSFANTSPYYTQIPIEIFDLPLTNLTMGGIGYKSVTFAKNNFDKLPLLKNTLTNLSLAETSLADTNNGEGPLPEQITELSKLRYLACINTRHTVIPAMINQLTGLTTLSYNYTSTLLSVGDISALTNLKTINHTNAYSISTDIPSYYAQTMVKLVTWTFSGAFRTQERMLSFIDNMYSFITSNAAISASGSSSFRTMVISINETTNNDGTVIPEGIYQQPTEYIKDISNGNPSSSLEKIWVLVNQYAHTWTYRAT